MMAESQVTLSGLDGANPLAYLAALGVLRILDLRARRSSRPLPRLSWSDEGCWRPVIHGAASIDAIIAEVMEDKPSWSDDPAFLLAYEGDGETLVRDPRRSKGKVTRDLKPKPAAMRIFLDDLANRTAFEQTPAELLLLRRALDTAAAYGSEMVADNNGNTKPNGFHFTAGQQQFLKAIAELQEGVNEADLHEALAGPWRRESQLPNMSWDATNARYYALRAKNPSGDKKTTIAGADWLAYVGLGTFPAFPRGTRLVTTGITGGWKDGAFIWPVWLYPATWRVASSIIRSVDSIDLPAEARQARGIGAVFRSSISRSDQGGYGSFAPAEVW